MQKKKKKKTAFWRCFLLLLCGTLVRNTSFGAVSIYALPNVLAARIIVLCMILQLCVCERERVSVCVCVCVFVCHPKLKVMSQTSLTVSKK